MANGNAKAPRLEGLTMPTFSETFARVFGVTHAHKRLTRILGVAASLATMVVLTPAAVSARHPRKNEERIATFRTGPSGDAATPADPTNVNGRVVLPESAYAELEPGVTGVLPTDAVVLKRGAPLRENVFITEAGRDQVARRSAADPAGSTDRLSESINPTAPLGSFAPVAIARRDQGDAIFTANFAAGTITKLASEDLSLRAAVPVGIAPSRVVIQPAIDLSSFSTFLSGQLSAATAEDFVAVGHHAALLASVESLERFVGTDHPSNEAVEARVAAMSRQIEDRVASQALRARLLRSLEDLRALVIETRTCPIK